MNDWPKNPAHPGRYHLMPGMPVYDKAGEMVGTVDDESLEHDYLIVRQGALLSHDRYLPATAIARVEPDGVYLKQSRRALRGKRYATPPQPEERPTTAKAARRTPDDATPATATPTATDTVAEDVSRVSVPLAAEELVPRRAAEQVGTVRLHKGVETHEQVLDVPLAHDEVIVERIPPDQLAASAAVGANELLIPIMEEQVVVQKRMVVKEYVRVRKRQVVEQRQVREPVRREVLSVQEQRTGETKQHDGPLVREMRAPEAEDTAGAGTNA